jgi:WD40 repeat protein
LSLLKSVHIHDSGWILAMCVLPVTGRLCTSAADRRIRFYDIHTWDLSREILLINAVTCMCTWRHLDDEILAYADDKGQVTFVNASKGFHVVEAKAEDLQYGKDKRRVTFANASKGFVNSRADDPLESQCWMWASPLRERLHLGWVSEIHMIDELGGIMSCGEDSTIVIYEYPPRYHPDRINHKNEVVSKRTLNCKRGHAKGVRCIAWVNSQKVIVSGGLERAILIWNPYTGNQIAQLVGHQEGIEKVFYSTEYDQVVTLALTWTFCL